MPNPNLHPKSELPEEQFENLQAFKFYTANKTDTFWNYLTPETRSNEAPSSSSEYLWDVLKTSPTQSKSLYGMTPEQYLEGIKFHDECFSKIRE